MKIAVVGANTALGSSIVRKAEESGIGVVSLVTSAINLAGQGRVVIKNFQDLLISDFNDCHCIVDTESFLRIDKYSSDLLPIWHLLELLKGSSIKLLTLGSSSFLYTDKSRRNLVYESECLCSESEAISPLLCVNAYNRLKSCDNVNWSVLCPPLLIDKAGYGCGNIEFSNDILPMGVDGDSSISQSDFSLATIEL